MILSIIKININNISFNWFKQIFDKSSISVEVYPGISRSILVEVYPGISRSISVEVYPEVYPGISRSIDLKSLK